MLANLIRAKRAPDGPFDTPLTAAKVLAAVKETGFIV